MTLGVGRRVIIVDGAERWREADVKSHLSPALAAMAPETTLGIFAREDARAKAPGGLHEAVKKAGGVIGAQMTMKRWELPKWVREQAGRLGLSLDMAAAKALVEQVGERQQRLLRELEKLALEGGSAEDRLRARPEDGRGLGDRSAGGPLGRVPGLGSRRLAGRRRRAGGDPLIPAPARAGRAPGGPQLLDGRADAGGARDLAASGRGRLGRPT